MATVKKILIPAVFILNACLTLAGFALLLESPYTGIRMGVCGDHGCVKTVDKDSPAQGKIHPGDRVLDVAGLKILPLVFYEDPDYIRSERDFSAFWTSEYALHTAVVKRRPLDVLLEREGRQQAVSLVPAQFPFSEAFFRTAPIYLVGWTFLTVAYLVYRKKANEASAVFLLVGVLVCIDWAAGAPFTVRDIAFDYHAFRVLNRIDFVSALLLVCAFLHLALVFPKRLLSPGLHSRIIAGLYAFAFLLIALRFLNFFENTYLTTYTVFSVSLTAAIVLYVAQYFTEKNTGARRQIKWIVLSTLTSSVIYGGLSSFPVMFGSQFVSVALSGLAFILIPLSFAFAITRYRLMEIESILDGAVIYGFTILVLAAVETAFLGFVSPYVLTRGRGLPLLSVIAVLLIVFIYVPVRDRVKGAVERLFKRGRYDVEKELQRFTVDLGLCDDRPVLEKFTAFAGSVIGPSGVVVLRIARGRASLLHADNEGARNQGSALLPGAGAAWESVRSKGSCAFGYEFSEKVAAQGLSFPADLENALFVPFIADFAEVRDGYLAVLLKKGSELSYSAKDVVLLNAIASNIAGIIEAGELRKERDAIREGFLKEKDDVMKELHDGLGNILTSITVTSQAAQRVCAGSAPETLHMVQRIEEYSAEAMDFMRTGLTVIDNPRSDLTAIMDAVKDRFSSIFDAAGIELAAECGDEAGRVRPGAVIALNITRIIQEAFGNIIKHAGATQARMRIDRAGDQLMITLSDNGKGFPADQHAAGYGLRNMQRRIDLVKGTMQIDSAPGAGATIRLTLPLAAEQEKGGDAGCA